MGKLKTSGRTDAFLREAGIHPRLYDIGGISRDFALHMSLGLEGRGGSLKMLPTYIPAGKAPRDGEPVAALDAGGTNFRRALVEFRGGRPVVSEFLTAPMPGAAGEVALPEFLDFVCAHVEPFLGRTRRAGFCFSYAFESTPELDGRILSLSKEMRISGIEGVLLGEALRGRLRGRGAGEEVRIAVINDAAACLLGGTAECGLRGVPAGLVVGSGLNMCMLTPGKEIKKLPRTYDMLVNFEAGSFDVQPVSEPDRLLDAVSETPGGQRLEKMVSGVYLGPLVLETLRLAARGGVFSKAAASKIEALGPLGAGEAEGFLEGDMPPFCEDEADFEALRTIVLAVYHRAARLVCAMLEAAAGRAPSGLFVTADGSVFHKSRVFREELLRLVGERGLPVTFQRAENGNLVGAALAARSV